MQYAIYSIQMYSFTYFNSDGAFKMPAFMISWKHKRGSHYLVSFVPRRNYQINAFLYIFLFQGEMLPGKRGITEF